MPSGPRPGARPIYSARTSNKEQKIFMSSPACADGYDTPAQQREDPTTFMVAKVTEFDGSES